MRSAWLLCLVAGCGFSGAGPVDDPGTDPGADDPGAGTGGGSDTDPGPAPVASMCDVTDPQLRLCLTFDQTPMVQDLVAPPHSITDTVNVMSTPARDTTMGTAARFAQSHIQFANSGDFDLSQLTIEMWIDPTKVKGPGGGVLLDRDGQYTASYDANGVIRCTAGGQTVMSKNNIDNNWHHVACRFDSAASELRVYIDGSVAGCVKPPVPVQVGVTTGLVIGASRGPAGYLNPFTGVIDGVHLYARALADAEICGAAGKTSCATSCPD